MRNDQLLNYAARKAASRHFAPLPPWVPPVDEVEVDPRPGMIAVACCVGALICVAGALLAWGCS